MKVLITKIENTPYSRGVFNGVDIFGRTEDGQKYHATIEGMRPYMYVDGYPTRISEVVEVVQKGGQTLKNAPLVKLFTKVPGDIPKVRARFETHYEADVSWTDRVRFDCGIKSTIDVPKGKRILRKEDILPVEDDYTIKPRYMVIDIENWDEGPFPDPTDAPQPMVMWTAYDSYKDKYMVVVACKPDELDDVKVMEEFKEQFELEVDVVIKKVDTEYRLLLVLKQFLEMIGPDIVTGWNFEFYDWPYIIKRMERAGIEFDPSPYAVIDTKDGYKAIRDTGGPASLEEVCKKELGTGKLPTGRIHEEWNKNREKLTAYNIGDVWLCEQINLLKGVIDFHSTICRFAGSAYENWKHNSMIADAYLFHRLSGVAQMPSRGVVDTKRIEAGAIVFKPHKGLLENIVVFDNKSEYPSIMRSLNMSPETRVTSGKMRDSMVFTAPSGSQYVKSPRGLIPLIFDELIDRRKEMQEEMKKHALGTPEYKSWWQRQFAAKSFINSFYGILGSVDKHGRAKFRLADGQIGSDVTKIGRDHARWNADKIKEMGYKVTYGDTDSVMFQIPTFDPDLVLDVERKLNESFHEFAAQFGCSPEDHYFIGESEKIYEAFFQGGTKKRYAGLIKWSDGKIRTESEKDRMDVKGYEVRRSNSAQITQEIQEEILLLILKQESWETLRQIIQTIIDRIKEGQLDKEIAIPCGLSSAEYKKSLPIHARAAAYSNEYLGKNFQYGDRPRWWYVKGVIGKPKTNVAALEWFDEPKDFGLIIDYDQMVRRCLQGPLGPILEGSGRSWDDVLAGMRDASLEEFW